MTILLTLILMPKTLAKYETAEKFDNKLEIAQPVFQVKGTELVKINSINDIGYYDFTVKNYNEEKTGEVDFLYTIEIISNVDDSVKFELYKNGQLVNLNNRKTETMSIKGNQKTEEKYRLKVIYDKTRGTNGKDILEDVQIKIHSEQGKIG